MSRGLGCHRKIYFLPFFSRMLLLKDTVVKGAWMSSKNFKNTFWNCHIIWSSKICITPLSYLFFPKPTQEHCVCHWLHLFVFKCMKLYAHYSSCTSVHLFVSVCHWLNILVPKCMEMYPHYSSCSWLHLIVTICHWLHLIVFKCMKMYQYYSSCTNLHLIVSMCHCLIILVPECMTLYAH